MRYSIHSNVLNILYAYFRFVIFESFFKFPKLNISNSFYNMSRWTAVSRLWRLFPALQMSFPIFSLYSKNDGPHQIHDNLNIPGAVISRNPISDEISTDTVFIGEFFAIVVLLWSDMGLSIPSLSSSNRFVENRSSLFKYLDICPCLQPGVIAMLSSSYISFI